MKLFFTDSFSNLFQTSCGIFLDLVNQSHIKLNFGQFVLRCVTLGYTNLNREFSQQWKSSAWVGHPPISMNIHFNACGRRWISIHLFFELICKIWNNNILANISKLTISVNSKLIVLWGRGGNIPRVGEFDAFVLPLPRR